MIQPKINNRFSKNLKPDSTTIYLFRLGQRVGRGIARVGSRVVVAEGAVRCELAALGVFAARGRFVIQLVGKRLFMENG